MSTAPAQSKFAGLLVGSFLEDSMDACADRLRRAGVPIHRVDDVYAAMAMLTERPELRIAVVDVSSLDRFEASFVTLAPRYFPRLRVLIPRASGTLDRMISLGLTGEPATLEYIEEELRGIAGNGGHAILADQAASPRREPPPTQLTPASAFPQPDDEGDAPSASNDAAAVSEPSGEPSLHEAVRMRMAGNDPRMIRRKPPTGPSAATPRPPTSTSLSAAEVSALLGEESGASPNEDTDDEGTDPS
ncbi:MAG: hypothetical protein HS101_09655 [Planctomycetia bacterium]|jgi:hypothetical protein|nr:hypothetical protein [Planctomycetia bacterium]OQZ06597.1 MAG: hypothetical protein B6D36_04155 [Planctomycetes bacterium UTPLA1]